MDPGFTLAIHAHAWSYQGSRQADKIRLYVSQDGDGICSLVSTEAAPLPSYLPEGTGGVTG